MQDRAALLDIARHIGETLCRAATWDSTAGTCFWKRTAPAVQQEDFDVSVAGISLYGGSAGIALFLSQLHRTDPRDSFKRASLGGLRFAQQNADQCQGALSASLFMGHAGIALATSEICRNLEEPPMDGEVLALALRNSEGRRALDFVGGTAGSIVALLALHRTRPCNDLLERAVALGIDLCARADWYDACCTWDVTDASGFEPGPPLAGLSHGASGFALALMQLFEMTGEREFLAAARGAYAYEDTLFIEEIGEWLDVRSAESRTQALAAQSAPSAWCHGGGGIGLSRAEAARIDRERSEEYCTSVRIAAASTRKALEHALETPRSDATLCHGIAGHMEILNILQRRGYGEELGRMALVAANRLAALCDDGHDWPSGRPGGEPDQSLMIGDAGIGHALLRLCDDRILSPVLLIG